MAPDGIVQRMAQDDAWPQDDVAARETLLAWLEGKLPLNEAAAKYVSCFPPAAGMNLDHVKQTWSGWNSAMRERLARQIRRSMASGSK
jgi:hypothetical protein